MCLCSLLLTYSEVDLAASHHIVQEAVLNLHLQTQQGHVVSESISHALHTKAQVTPVM